MYTAEELLGKIERSLKETNFLFHPAELYEPIRYSMSMGGKRIRPLLTLMGTDLFGGDIGKAMAPGLGLEIFHNFTLVHDDIMDNASIRRGKPTVFKKWDTNTAILSGDTMFILAGQFVSRVDPAILPQVLSLFNQTAREVCEGQQLDMNFEKQEKVSIGDYLEMIRLKTAVLLGACLKTGAIIGNATGRQADDVYSFGVNLGMAFQLQDDLLDAFADQDKFGKETGGDIACNKKTYLYLQAFRLAEGEDLRELGYYFGNDAPERQLKIQRVTEIFRKLDIPGITSKAIEEYHQKALSCLSQLEIAADRKKELAAFAGKMIKREF